MPRTVPPVVYTARRLRRQMTLPEVMLWQLLRGSPGGIKFRRQHPIGRYVVDFFCGAAGLAIEIDGRVHDGPGRASADLRRDAYLREHGLHVVRIAAADVLADSDRVATEIIALAGAPLHPQPSAGGPPPRAGEE